MNPDLEFFYHLSYYFQDVNRVQGGAWRVGSTSTGLREWANDLEGAVY